MAITNKIQYPYKNRGNYLFNQFGAPTYKAFNGLLSAPYLANSSSAASTLQGTVASAPAALSTMVLTLPGHLNGASVTFQFVYTGGAAPTVGIPITLPAGGGTATQVRDAIVAAINAGSGVDTVTGKRTYFQAVATSQSTNQFTLTGTRNGIFGAPAGTQATITWVTGNTSGSTIALPSRVGPLGTYIGIGQ